MTLVLGQFQTIDQNVAMHALALCVEDSGGGILETHMERMNTLFQEPLTSAHACQEVMDQVDPSVRSAVESMALDMQTAKTIATRVKPRI